jgi:riboflavin biosynthesis pyrimidine reductase
VSANADGAPRFVRLRPANGGSTTVTADEALQGWRDERRGRDGVAINMVASVDGRIAVGGRSAPLGNPGDRALFHALRGRADAVLVSAGTVRGERYGPLVRDQGRRERRRAESLQEQPLAAIASRSLDLDPSLPLLADPASRVVILTPAAGDIAATAARVDYVRAVSLRAGLAELRERFDVDVIVCEGGPWLNGSLAAESLIDELFLTISPLLVGDLPDGGAVMRGGAPPSLLALELRMLLAADSGLYARYVAAG